ncbi:hypothetical protein [Nonomuraea sp. NEAU-A123]|nr:hypothetical protein [Nonomuraea sp. NEAU-A123]
MGQTIVKTSPSPDGNTSARRLAPASGATCPNAFRPACRMGR